MGITEMLKLFKIITTVLESEIYIVNFKYFKLFDSVTVNQNYTELYFFSYLHTLKWLNLFNYILWT